MKLPNDVECIDEADLVEWRPHGLLNQAQANKILIFVVEQERKFGRPFNRFTDMSALEAVELSFKWCRLYHLPVGGSEGEIAGGFNFETSAVSTGCDSTKMGVSQREGAG
jgi:hypothetical protein